MFAIAHKYEPIIITHRHMLIQIDAVGRHFGRWYAGQTRCTLSTALLRLMRLKTQLRAHNNNCRLFEQTGRPELMLRE